MLVSPRGLLLTATALPAWRVAFAHTGADPVAVGVSRALTDNTHNTALTGGAASIWRYAR